MSSSIFLTGGVEAFFLYFFFFFLSTSAAVAFHFHIPLSLLLFGVPASTISSALFLTKINMRCCSFILHLLSSSCRSLLLTVREIGMMKQQVRERRKPCSCQGTCFHNPYLLIHWISLSIFNQIWWMSSRPGQSADLLTRRRFPYNYLHAGLVPSFILNSAPSVFHHLPSLHIFLHHPRALNLIPNGSLLSLTMPKERASQ